MDNNNMKCKCNNTQMKNKETLEQEKANTKTELAAAAKAAEDARHKLMAIEAEIESIDKVEVPRSVLVDIISLIEDQVTDTLREIDSSQLDFELYLSGNTVEIEAVDFTDVDLNIAEILSVAFGEAFNITGD